MRKLAVVCSGWHYPKHFYEMITNQKLPCDWQMELFCISHRDPYYAKEEKKDDSFEGNRAYLDKLLYNEIIVKEDIVNLNWNYKQYENSIGDWGCSNQWLDDNQYSEYDLLLFTHDDNLILSNEWFLYVINSYEEERWDIFSNSSGAPKGWLRGSCEFFTSDLLKRLGGRFDLSMTTLNRTGKTSGTGNLDELADWNTTVIPLMNFIKSNKIKIHFDSDYYRVSKYCLEGERGYISRTTISNIESENIGLKKYNLI